MEWSPWIVLSPVSDGNVCLNILREDWKPVLTINSIVYGLQYLFLEPNPDDPLNKEAATELQANRDEFSLWFQQFFLKNMAIEIINAVL